MNRHKRVLIYVNTLLLAILALFTNCNPYHPASGGKTSTLGNPMRDEKTELALGSYANIQSLKVCLKEVLLTGVSGNLVNVPFSPLKEMPIPMTGLDLGLLPIPPGQYTKISLQLADVCGTGRSVVLTNGQGTFSSSAQIQLKFSGNEFVGSVIHKVVFDIQELTANLSQVGADANVPAAAASSSGNYHSLSCGIQSETSGVAFCEAFDQASPAVSRSGQLNSTRWNVSRTGPSNQGQGQFVKWYESTLNACGTLQPAKPDGSDIVICDGQLRESVKDGGEVPSLTMSVNQPFDFAGRTGTIAFDITNDTSGSIGTWPAIWISEQALPGLQNFRENSTPKNGVSIRFSGALNPNQGAFAPGCVNDAYARWIVDSVTVFKDYVPTEIGWSISNDTQLVTLGCVIASDGPNGKMNHVELRVSQNQIEIWASNAGSPVLQKIALAKNLALPFTRGYLSLSDVHNNAAAGPRPETVNHTYAWDNIAFDGPALKSDLSFNVLDSVTDRGNGEMNLGWQSPTATPVQLTTLPLAAADIAAATASGKTPMLTFNVYFWNTASSQIHYSIDGGATMTGTIPFPTVAYQSYSVAFPVPVSALSPGTQNISIWSDSGILILSNVDIRLIGAGQ